MKRKNWLCILLVLTLLLAGCAGDGAAVYVQSVKELAGMGGIAPGDRFGGLVVSENVAQIQKDGEKKIAQLLVKAGDDVQEGQELFSYDTEELQLTLDKQRLELEQLKASIENFKVQIADLEKDRNQVSTANKLQYTIEIQSLQVNLKEAELNVKSKETEVARSEEILNNATVVSPVTGRVQSVSENGTDNYGNPLPYITIQQAGSYRVKGTIGELQRGGITEGSRIKITSRTNAEHVWYGTVSLVDYENPSQGNSSNVYYGMAEDEMSSSSKYPFYVELDITDGLILGQHVYMELDMGEEETPGLSLDMAFVAYEEDGSAFVWAENGRKLEKRPVVLGEMNPMMGTVEILEGLSEEDYIAFPDPELCQPGAATTHNQPEISTEEEGGVA